MSEVVIVDALRSAVGKKRGSLAGVAAPDLLGDVLNGLIDRLGVDPALVDQAIMGCVTQIGEQASNVARNAWLGAGLPYTTAATTVHAQCGSAQQATTLGYGLVASGVARLVVTGGIESMNRVPMFATTVAEYGNARTERYREIYENTTQFEAADRIAEKWGFSREDLERFAVDSQSRAADAIADGRFDSQIVGITVDGTVNGPPTIFAPRRGPPPTTMEGLAGLRLNQPERVGAAHTAGTSSQIADGASALLLATSDTAESLGLTPRARIVDTILVGSQPEIMLTGPISATQKLLERTGLSVDDIDLFEVNEAFASVVLAWEHELGADHDRVNVNGGAIALGHPLGATGGILLTKALYELERRDARRAVVTMCCGGGLGTATLIERV